MKNVLILALLLNLNYGCGRLDVVPYDSNQNVNIPDTEHTITHGYDLQGMYDFFEEECRFKFRHLPNSAQKETIIKTCTYAAIDNLLATPTTEVIK